MLDTLVAAITGQPVDHAPVIEAVRNTLDDPALDAAFVGEAVLLPSEAFIGDQMAVVDPDAICRRARGAAPRLGRELEARWRAAYAAHRRQPLSNIRPSAKGLRRLRIGRARLYRGDRRREDAPALAFAQFEAADNMTDRQGALTMLANGDAPEREAALDIFYNRYSDNALVLDKWFPTQALSTRDDTRRCGRGAGAAPRLHARQPQPARSLVGAFAATSAPSTRATGAAIASSPTMIALDKLNPQTAAKLVPPLGRWRRFEPGRAALMRAELERIVATPGLSKDVFEQASKSLA